MATGGTAFVGGVSFAPPLTLAIARSFVNFSIFVGAYVLVGDRAEATGILGEVGFGLRMLEVEERVVLFGSGILFGIGIGLRHGMDTGRDVGGKVLSGTADYVPGLKQVLKLLSWAMATKKGHRTSAVALKWRVQLRGVYPTFSARAPPHERSFLSTFPARAGVLMGQSYKNLAGERKWK